MRSSPSIAPSAPDDIDIYLVLDQLGGRLGRVWRESDEEATDRKTLVTDLLDGQYKDPARIVAFTPPSAGREMFQRSSPMRLSIAAAWMVLTCRHSSRISLRSTLPRARCS
jgi:hypothetical protein